MRWHELELTVVGRDGSLERAAGFIVKNMHGWRLVRGRESRVDIVVGRDPMCIMFGGKRADQDCIALRVKRDHDVLISAARAGVEAAGVIRENAVDW
jgi:hypothetical protein